LLVDAVRRNGFSLLRSGALLLFYLGAEVVGLLAAACLWLARPFAGWDAARWRDLHFQLQSWWATTLFHGLVRCFDLRVEVEGLRDARLGDGPYLMLIRHTSAGDTLLASALIGRPYGMRLRYVLKRELLRDPCLDVVGQRLPHYFVDRASEDPGREVARVQELARGLSRHDGVLIYPEGTRYTAARRTRVLERLAQEGDAKLLEYASALRHVLPPRPRGTLGLLDAAPGADVVVCAHAGFEITPGQLARGALWRRTIHVVFERVPRARIPAGRDARAQWLREVWRDVDAWVASRSS
jgi:1-acyl-sn-glycerol-3-phosphate acyltransferase